MWTYIRQIPDLKIFIMLFIVLSIFGIYSFVKKKRSHFLYDRLYSDCFILCFLIGIYFSPTVIRKSFDSISPWLTLQTIPFKTLKNLGFISIAGHIVLTMPIPILIYIILRASVKKISIISILAGIFIEPIQLLINLITGFPNYVIDIDDFMLQIAGILVGLFIITLAEKYHIYLKRECIFALSFYLPINANTILNCFKMPYASTTANSSVK